MNALIKNAELKKKIKMKVLDNQRDRGEEGCICSRCRSGNGNRNIAQYLK